jgi:hypothetical protein
MCDEVSWVVLLPSAVGETGLADLDVGLLHDMAPTIEAIAMQPTSSNERRWRLFIGPSDLTRSIRL